jgi:hypothetical protein
MAELHAFLALTHYDPAAAERLLSCIRSNSATPTHRIEAAITLLKCADMVGREDLREIAIGQTAGADLASVDTVTRLEFEILVASTQGDRRRAAFFGRQLIYHFKEGSDSSTPLRYYVTGVCALQLGGFEPEAIVEYERLERLADRRASPRCRLVALVQLASLHFDAGREAQADESVKAARMLTSEWPELGKDFSLATTRLEMELLRGHFDSAKRIVGELSDTIPQANRLRRRWLDAAAIAIKSGRGQLRETSRDVLCQMGRDRLKSISGIRDFEVAVAVESLLQLHFTQDATAVVTEYLLSERQTSRRPSRLLARAIDSTRRFEGFVDSSSWDRQPLGDHDWPMADILTDAL